MGIDNALVEIDNLEVPILDGSGQPFVRLIREAGIRQLRTRRKYLRIRRTIMGRIAGSESGFSAGRLFPFTLRPGLSAPVGGNRSSSKSRPNGTLRRSHSQAHSAGKTTWTRCATWA